MKNLFIFIILLSALHSSSAQVDHHLIYQPGPEEGKDADIQSVNEFNNINSGDKVWFRAESWTRFGADNYIRGLIDFPIQSLISQGDSIIQVELTLYKDLEYPFSSGGSFGENASRLHCITESWSEHSVTWNNQPAYDPSVFIDIPTNNDYDSIVIDITDVVKNRLARGDFYGFLIRNVLETPYKSMNFMSSDGLVPQRRPKISLTLKSEMGCYWTKVDSSISYTGGNVAIGTLSSNGYRLSVNGKTFSKEVVVDPQGWPDYVFEGTYKLPPLEYVKKFIETHHHLPEVPNAETVKRNGIGLSEISTILLKKVEELSLYIIQQNHRIEELERKLEEGFRD